MAQEEVATIIDLNASRANAGDGGKIDQGATAGAALAKARRSAGLSLASVSTATKVKIDHLIALESSDYEALPAAVYATGFVRVYAGFLGLDAQAFGARFRSELEDAVSPSDEVIDAGIAPSMAPHISEGARLVSIFGIIAILIFVVWIVMNVAGAPGEREATISAPQSRVRLGEAVVAEPVFRPRTKTPVSTTAQTPDVDEVMAEESDIATPTAGSETSVALNSDANPATDNSPLETETPVELSNPATEQIVEPVLPDATGSEEEVSPPSMAEAAVETLAEIESIFDLQAPVRQVIPARRVPKPAVIVVEAILTRSIAPQYPNRCTRNAESLETVTVKFDVTTQGRADNVRTVASSNRCFESTAISTLRRWRFSPKTVDGVAQVDLGKQATLNFRR